MNRLILIGNGFDLAHGLKTSYADFIEWYWEEWGKRLRGGKKRIGSRPFCFGYPSRQKERADYR